MVLLHDEGREAGFRVKALYGKYDVDAKEALKKASDKEEEKE